MITLKTFYEPTKSQKKRVFTSVGGRYGEMLSTMLLPYAETLSPPGDLTCDTLDNSGKRKILRLRSREE
jgi:hypothetical protein